MGGVLRVDYGPCLRDGLYRGESVVWRVCIGLVVDGFGGF